MNGKPDYAFAALTFRDNQTVDEFAQELSIIMRSARRRVA